MEKNKWIIIYLWKKILKDNIYQEFNNIEEAKQTMGFNNNVAFDWPTAENVFWKLNDKVYLSATVTFNSQESFAKFIDNKHFHDKNKCYLANGVDLILPNKIIYIDHLGRKFSEQPLQN